MAGASEAALLNGVFWGSTQDGVSETLPDSKAFASLDQSGFEAAIAEMNDAIAASMMAQLVQVGYTYDTSLGHPVLTGRPLTGASPTSIYKFTPCRKIRQG